jgi:fatty acid/phospholipid biosynthesis enzyme
MQQSGNKKDKDFAIFPYDINDERAVKLDYSGNVILKNGKKGTILGVKGVSKDGSKKFIKVFAQVGVLFKGDDNKFTGNMNYPDAGGGSLIGWANDAGTVLSGYNNENKEEAKPQPSRQQSF